MKIRQFILLSFLGHFFFVSSCQNAVQDDSNSFTIEYEKFTLENGLEVVLHEDHSDPIVAVATLVHVGSNREKPGRTGFAHFFEHMSFNDSENVPRGANRKLIPEWGGQRNGGTWSDGTIYYEVVPRDAFEKILWIDSDRLGYMINTVTEAALEREKQVVKNEKRENYDNAPYGFTGEVIRKNLYPADHPYSWTVIGELEDLQAATLEDVKEFYDLYYGAANATLVIAGDIDVQETKDLVKLWFGEIRKGPAVERLPPMPVSLTETKSVYFEDNFAKLPELRMVFPTVEEYHADQYALEVLAELLSGSKKSPLYKVIVDEEQLAPGVSAYQNSSELAGEFTIRIRANSGIDLDLVKNGIERGLSLFEENGFSDNELLRIKAELETDLYQDIETVLNKAFNLVVGNEFAGNPAQIVETAKLINMVSKEDVYKVFEKYIKKKHYVLTSFVPKGQIDLIVEGSKKAEVYEEKIEGGLAHEEVSQGEEAQYEKTSTQHDRSEPDFGEMPFFKTPAIWKATLPKTEIEVLGIENREVPLVRISMTVKGGHWMDELDKPGVANLMSELMMEGTKSKTPEELEEVIGLLGADISIGCGNEDITITATCLSKNFDQTVKLIQEILLEPRWDPEEFSRLKQSLETRLKGGEANPRLIAYFNFMKIMYGSDHILGWPVSGTLDAASTISLDDLKSYYQKYMSPAAASVQVAGFIDKDAVLEAFSGIDQSWESSAFVMPEYQVPQEMPSKKIYFIDVPGAKQSVIYLGNLALSAQDPNFNKLTFANEVLGGGASGMLFQTLRIEKGYTYGFYSSIMQNEEISPFIARGSVRANATYPSLKVIEDMIGNYGPNFSEQDMETTKTKILKENTRSFESLNAKLNILRNINKYGWPENYIEESQDELVNMSLDDFKDIIAKYLVEQEMVYVIVGDKETQLAEVNRVGKGNAVELDIYGAPK